MSIEVNMSYEEKQKFQKKQIKEYVKTFESNNFKCTHIYEHGFNVVINNLQDIFIRPFDSKSCASLTANSTLFKNIHIKEEFKRKEIGFKANKSPIDLFNDINKRLITSNFCIEQFNHLNESFNYHSEYENKKNNTKKEIEKINLDLRDNSNKESFTLYLKEGYGSVNYRSDSIDIDLKSLPKELGLEILKFIEKSENKK